MGVVVNLKFVVGVVSCVVAVVVGVVGVVVVVIGVVVVFVVDNVELKGKNILGWFLWVMLNVVVLFVVSPVYELLFEDKSALLFVSFVFPSNNLFFISTLLMLL